MKNDEQSFSMAEVAERYQVDISTVSRWIDAGFLPGSEKKGPYRKSPWRIPQTAIDHFEEQRKVASS